MKRILFGLLAVAAVAVVIGIAMRPQPVPVSVEAVVRGPLTVTLDEEGRTRVRERYLVLAPLDGLLHRIHLEAGDRAEGGATEVAIVEPLSSTLLDERSVAMAEARVGAADASLARAREGNATAERLLEIARDDLLRQQNAGTAVSAQDVANARRELHYREGELAAAGAAIRVAEAELDVAQAALLVARPSESVDGPDGGRERRPIDAGGLLVVHAPVDGRVLRVLRKDEGPVRIGEPLVELGDTEHLEIVADYLTTEAVRIQPGMEAIVEEWGGEGPIAARVRRVEPAARTKVSSLGVEEQRVDVVLDLVDPPPEAASLADGFRVEVRVVVWRGEDVVLVPEAALVREGDEWTVFRRVDGIVESVAVRLDHRDGRSAEVVEGLSVGDEVVIYPSDRLVDGARVRVR
ncbi:MAG: HlyD family efflux transporter periplasmic adaptor subunit [Planctomycetota bacterium]